VKEFFLAIYGCSFYEGYGQTEATAAVAGTLPGDFNVGHVGCVAPCCHLKLADVPNMGLDWRRDGKGEICIRGPVCTPGYWKMPEKTKELYDEDGWLHTGDIGSWMPNGTIKIVDRCKNIFKLAQGEYVSPEKVEMFLVQSPYVAQICVDGNSLRTFCVAIVVPDFENLLDPKLANNVEEQRKLCEDSDGSLYRKILDSLTEMAKKGKLNGFEMVKDIHITTEPFSITNDLLTPTMKLRRGAIRDRYSTEIEKLYARHSTPNA
jgi:long-chain acyl-CoA synthetase